MRNYIRRIEKMESKIDPPGEPIRQVFIRFRNEEDKTKKLEEVHQEIKDKPGAYHPDVRIIAILNTARNLSDSVWCCP